MDHVVIDTIDSNRDWHTDGIGRWTSLSGEEHGKVRGAARVIDGGWDDELKQLATAVRAAFGAHALGEAGLRALETITDQGRPIPPDERAHIAADDGRAMSALPMKAFSAALKAELRRLLKAQ
jgi:hypothetical protein